MSCRSRLNVAIQIKSDVEQIILNEMNRIRQDSDIRTMMYAQKKRLERCQSIKPLVWI